jgi:hypothetical protein
MLGEGTFPYDLACGEGGEGIFQQTSFHNRTQLFLLLQVKAESTVVKEQ